jgi:uncharacterized protein (DUF488 family)
MPTFFTVGHSTRSLEAFLALLRDAGVGAIADVRRFPASRRHPHFNRETLEGTLPAAGVVYRHFAALGGRRGGAGPAASPNGWGENDAFRAYADHALGAEFAAALHELRTLGAQRTVAVMCAEALWWRCHRRLVADYLLAAGEPVVHLLELGKSEPAALSPGARVQPDGRIHYPPEADQLALQF